METFFVVNLLEIASADENIDDFVNFCDAVHEKTGCTQERCNSGSLVKERVGLVKTPSQFHLEKQFTTFFLWKQRHPIFFIDFASIYFK